MNTATALDARTIETIPVETLLTQRRRMLRELRATSPSHKLRIAVLGGTTTNELVDFLELHLLANGFNPSFYQSEYGRFYEDAVLDCDRLIAFHPHLVYIHTSYRNVLACPSPIWTEKEHQLAVQNELGRFRNIWNHIHENLGCQIIQNNFELPPVAALGNMDGVLPGGNARFVLDLNAAFAAEARSGSRLLIQDIHSISAQIGLDRWFDWNRWYSYKMLYSPEGTLAITRSLNAMIKSLYGKSRKVLVLDLDNTVWGGVIGDDGIDKIQIGRETPVAEAFTSFQEYLLRQRERGVLLAVCSKNDEEVARQGFSHPDSILKIEHFSAFRANWEPKHENLRRIAEELNLGLDSFVFVDDNPAERLIVQSQVPGVAVPDVGTDVAKFISALESGRFFEPTRLSTEDLNRAQMYAQRTEQAALEAKFADYGEYLDYLQMKAEIDSFRPIYLDRIAQLTNKTNQFNLTTRRHTLAEMEAFAADPTYITLYGRLKDRFGDNGLVSVVLGRKSGDSVHIELWLMSCRVLKRDLEVAMIDCLVERTRSVGAATLIGYYFPTQKNGMVANHYQTLRFEELSRQPDGSTEWALDIQAYTPGNKHIQVTGFINE